MFFNLFIKKKAKAQKVKLPKRETKVERKNKGQIVFKIKIKHKYKNNCGFEKLRRKLKTRNERKKNYMGGLKNKTKDK